MRTARLAHAAVGVLLVAAVTGSAISAPVSAAPAPVAINATGANGEGEITVPGRRCVDGGDGAYWHYDYDQDIAGGVFSSLPGALRLHLDLHSNQMPAPTGAFLLGDASTATIANDRGVLPLILRAGTCDNHALGFDGTTATGGGTWVAGAGTGAYRDATGAGNFTLTAAVAPGADNPFTVGLTGSVQVLQPKLKVEVVRTYWGFLGTDFLLRRVSVVYRITNSGTGDAFGVRLTNVSAESGVTPRGPVPQHLGDLAAGESTEVRMRFEVGLKVCLLILGCEFNTTLHVRMPDALDVPTTHSRTVRPRAPFLGPIL
jgi:hypothetical protein